MAVASLGLIFAGAILGLAAMDAGLGPGDALRLAPVLALIMTLGGLAGGALFGFAGWLGLRGLIRQGWRWVGWSSLGWGLGLMLPGMGFAFLASTELSSVVFPLSVALAGALGGALAGWGQHRLLADGFPRSVRWIAASAVFTGIGWALTIQALFLVELLGGLGPVIAALVGGLFVTGISTTALSLLWRPAAVP